MVSILIYKIRLNLKIVMLVTDNNIQSDAEITRKVESVHLQKLFWTRGNLRARIIWKNKNKNNKYTVSWWSRPYRNNDRNFANFKLSATTKVQFF